MKEVKAGPRYKYPISSKELERRHGLIRAAMKEQGVDCLLTQVHSHIFDAYIRYLLDEPAGSYTTSLMFPVDGDIVLVKHGDTNDNAPIPPNTRGVEKIYTRPGCPPFCFTDYDAAEVFVKEIKARNYKRIGFIGELLMGYSFGRYITENLPGVEIVNFCDALDEIIAVKSEEEWGLIYKAVRAHEQLAAAVPSVIRPGRTENDIRADLNHIALELDCTIAFLSVGSAPLGQKIHFVPHFMENRRVEPGDGVNILLELGGPGGMYCELCRTWCLGEPPESLLWLWNVAKECQHFLAEKIVPGLPVTELNNYFDEFVSQYGLPKNLRYFGHGQGYNMMERPAFCSRENMILKEDMHIAIHPELTKGNDFVNCCDNFRITKNGAVRLGKTPQEIFRIEI